jgi:hypothetical protein
MIERIQSYFKYQFKILASWHPTWHPTWHLLASWRLYCHLICQLSLCGCHVIQQEEEGKVLSLGLSMDC